MKRRRILGILAAAMLGGAAAPARAAAGSGLRPFDATSLAALKRRFVESPFVLALWSIHCAPCLEDMATWRRLLERHPGLAIVLVATDGPREHGAVARMLTRFPPGPVETWAYADGFEERIRFSIDPRWRGELPRTYLFDRSHHADVVTGRVDHATMDAWAARVATRS